jgi:hypothetical protein
MMPHIKQRQRRGGGRGGEEEEEVPEDDGICRVAGRGGGGGGGGDDGDYYDLPHVRRAAARPVRRIRHSEVVLVDAPLDDGRSKRMIMMCRRTQFFSLSLFMYCSISLL